MQSSARPRLAYVVNALNPGGTEKLVVEMSLAFAAEYDIAVICLDEPGQWGMDLRTHQIPVYCVWRQPGLDFSMVGKLAQLFRRLRIDLVHAHQCTPWFYSALARLLYPRARVLLEEHGRFYPEVDNLKRRLLNRLLVVPLTQRFVAVSQDVRSRLHRYEGIPARRIAVIYNGAGVVDAITSSERNDLRAALVIPPGSFVVGTVGRLDPIKNLPMFVDAVVRAKQHVPELQAVIVGHGPMFDEVSAHIERAGAADYIRMTGYRADAKRLTQCFDLFVLASFSEGTSMALLEAIAVGVPVAVTNVGGNPEVVDENKTGWVIPNDDAEALASAMREAARNAQRREQFALAGRQRFAERFAFQRMIEQYRETYRELTVVPRPARITGSAEV
ncbi:MAG: glycosyltransferase [Steroidobacteraceae bacterium]